jgi:predicted HTH transcriptional regulator
LILLILSLGLFLKIRKKRHPSLEEFVKGQSIDLQISELIQQGENSKLEFKSSFRYDYHLKVVNKELEGVIAKSIAAFSNGKGGSLLIGVDDEGHILGLENDISTLKRKDIDFFENTLRTFLNKTFSVSLVTQNLHISFPVIEEKAICRIDIDQAKSPVFVELTKNSQKSERFYVRSGNTSQEIQSLSEMNEYINSRFP